MDKQPRMIDKDRLLDWINDNWEFERKAGTSDSDVRTEMWHEYHDKVVSGDFDPIPLPTIKPEEADIDGYSDKNIGFIRGVAYAAGLIKQYDTDSEQLIQESGITEEILRKYADDYDLKNLGILDTDSAEVIPNE